MPNEFSFYSGFSNNNIGCEFEREVFELLINEGYSVASNLVISHYNRRMEIDMMAFNNDQLIAISCRNALDVNCLMSFRLDIKHKANKIEHRMRLLNADSARLYIKVTKENYNRLVDFEGTWIKSVEIIFITE